MSATFDSSPAPESTPAQAPPPVAQIAQVAPAKTAAHVAMGLFILVFCAVVFKAALPPRALPLNAPPTAFSGERALAHSRKFAIEPRARGGAAAARGRDYIVQALKDIGCEVQIERDPVNHATSVTFVENVLGRIRGTANTKTFAMTAHYDSVAWGPGAADDGAGVVVMLEAARALMCGPQLKNDVVFVFTGDEEGGGNGSVVSLTHPWLKDLNVMLGLEARGDWGTANMFETSTGNLPLIEELAKLDCPTTANSLMYEVHRRTPNTTDFTHMAHHGALGYNVAFVGGLGYYHTANDSAAHVNPDTLQQQGEYVMALAKHYGNDGPKIERGEDGVYFNTIGKHLVVYSVSKERSIAIAALVLFLLALIVGFATRVLRPLGVLGGVLLALAAIALTSVIGLGLQIASYKLFYVYIMYNAAYYHLSFMLLGAAITFGLLTAFRKRLTPENLHGAVLLIWFLVLSIIETNWISIIAAKAMLWNPALAENHTIQLLSTLKTHVPVASFVAEWPVIFSAAGLALACGLRRAGVPRGVTVFIQVLSALPVICFILPGTYLLYHMGGALAPVPNTVLFLLLLLSLAPALVYIFANGAKKAALALAVLALLVFLCGWATQRFSPEKPKMNSISYALNLDTNKALWLTSDKVSDEWVSQFVPNDASTEDGIADVIPGYRIEARHAPAPIAPLAAPELTVVSDKTEAGKRELVLHYVTTRSPEGTRISVPGATRVLAASIDGMGDILADTTNWSVAVEYLPFDYQLTLHLTLDASAPGPVPVRIYEENFHLPELTTLGYRPRPSWMISKGNTLGWWENNRIDSNHTHLVKTFQF